MNKIEIDIIDPESFQGELNPFFNVLMQRVVKLSGDPDFLPGNTGSLDTLANLSFIAVGKRTDSC